MDDLQHSTLTGAPILWDADRDDTLVCREVRQETHDVKTFVLGAREPRLIRYAPGQFITLELEIGGQTVNRCYTLSSTPTRPDMVSITVKRVPGGTVSNWLHDNLQPGSELRVLGPSGGFSCYLQPMPAKQKYLFLSAGSGITPLMSMSRAAHDLALDVDIAFVHSARTPHDVIFARELQLMAYNRRDRFRLGVVCERRGDDPAWAGFDMANYHEESFSFETLSAQVAEEEPAVANAEGAAQFTVKFTRSGNEVQCGTEQTILGAAKAAGMRLPMSCTQGLCGTCKTKMVSGQVDMKHAGGIRQREIDQGWILPCCSKPLSDVVLER